MTKQRKRDKKFNINKLKALVFTFAVLFILYGLFALLNNLASETSNPIDDIVIELLIKPFFEDVNLISLLISVFNLLVFIGGWILGYLGYLRK